MPRIGAPNTRDPKKTTIKQQKRWKQVVSLRILQLMFVFFPRPQFAMFCLSNKNLVGYITQQPCRDPNEKNCFVMPFFRWKTPQDKPTCLLFFSPLPFKMCLGHVVIARLLRILTEFCRSQDPPIQGINNECIVTLFLCQLLRGVMEYDSNPHNAPIFRGNPSKSPYSCCLFHPP